MNVKEQITETFIEKFGDGGEIRCFFAPGRVNLIGEHTDYNGGHVFPCALTIGTYAAVRKRNDRKLRFYSMNFDSLGVIESDLEDLVYHKEADWTNYVKGVIWAFSQNGFMPDCGFDFLCYGTIPNKSGLSSSASLEILTGKVLISLFSFPVDNISNALYGQQAERKFVGVNCGIMDQFAISMGKKDHAIFLDTNTLDYEYAPLHLDGIKIVIGNTNKVRGLGDSKYNERRAECEEALRRIQTVKPIAALGELSCDEFEELTGTIADPVLIQRARHAVYENQRTIRAVKALKENNLELFGQLINQSHISLRDDYQVTGKELDALVEAAWTMPGVVGARMTGAGFGGCTVNLVETSQTENFISRVGQIYERQIGYPASFYLADIGGGPCEL